MTLGTRATTGLAMLAAATMTPSLAAQEIVEVTGRDKRMDADFEEVFRVGVLDGESWEMFARVRDVSFDARGNLYLLDGLGDISSGSVRVLVFDASGNFLREFGSSGEGPGEFNRPNSFAVMRDGTVVVGDMGHRAYQLFDESGNFVRMVRTADGPERISMSSIQVDPRGGAVFTGGMGSSASISIRGGGRNVAPPTSRPVTRLGLEGEVVHTDTVAEGWLPPRGEAGAGLPKNIKLGGGSVNLRDALGQFSMPAVFEPRLSAGVLPDGGVVHTDSSAYALKVTPANASGVTRIIRRPMQPEPMTSAIQEAYKERREAAREESGSGGGISMIMTRARASSGGASQPGQSVSFELSEPGYYPEIPVIRGLATTWEGHIWVQRRGDLPEDDGPIDVLTAMGEYVGTFPTGAIEMPDAFGPDGMAAFIELDDFDVASVVVRRLPTAIR